MQNRRYEKQFREQAVNLVVEQGREVCTVARDLGMPHSTLFKWLRECGWKKPVHLDRVKQLPDDPAVLKARICQLEGQVKELAADREILKKATAFFANPGK
jgi:transposase